MSKRTTGHILASILIFLIMADPAWGLLAKAQDDPQTINEAIDAAIAAHEADANAHMGAGESLDVHKQQDVIDHPFGSVLVDKHTFTEWQVDTTFQSLAGWSITGDVSIADLTGIKIYVEWGAVNTSRIYSNPTFIAPFFHKDNDMLYQVLARWQGSSTALNAWFGFFDTYTTSADGFGFQIRNGVLYATVACGGTLVDEIIADPDISLAHIYRAQYSATDDEVVFYIDAVEVARIARPAGITWDDDRGPEAGVTLTESNDGIFYIANLLVGRAIV